MKSKLSRRNFLKVAVASLTAAACSPKASAAVAKKKPNFIIIFADDLGYGDISGFAFNEPLCRTPNLDAMAAAGAKLTSFYVPTPYCAPSRASLLTGRYPFRNTVVYNPAPDAGINDVGLPASEITLAEALKPAGYETCCIGKWHLGHTEQYLPRTQGFDYYYGILYSNDMRPVQLVENESVVEYPVFQPTITQRYTDKALDFITRCAGADKPFFLYLPHAMPHKPLAASERFYTPETPDDLYADVIRELDHNVGRLLDKVSDLGIDDNTMIIFTSDNGPSYGGNTGGLRGKKAKSWEGGHRVPFIAKWPGRIPQETVNRSPVASVDIFPTILKAANVEVPSDRKIDGIDIMPALKSEAPLPHPPIFEMGGVNLMSVRRGKWKLHVRKPQTYKPPTGNWTDPRGPDGVTLLAQFEQATPKQYPGLVTGDKPREMMLFDIEADPGEQHDISSRNPHIVAQLKKLYDETLAQFPKFTPPNRRFKNLRRLTGGELKYDH